MTLAGLSLTVTFLGKVRARGRDRLGMAWQARHGKAEAGKAWFGKAWFGKARHGEARQARRGLVWRIKARPGKARLGVAGKENITI